MSGENLVLETKLFNMSTMGSSCNILNSNTDFKSLCEYNIPNMIERDETIEYIQFSVRDAVIPVSFYTVNENNSILNIIENGVYTSYNFPYGNYNANYFITEFVNLLGSRWSISLNNFNSIFTITNSQNNFTLLATSTIDSVLGFSDDISSSLTIPYKLTLPRCCNFLPLPRITLRCAELANTTMISSNSSNDVIITIPNNARPNGQIYYQNQSQAKLLFRHHELSRFVVSFTDDNGNLLNFNGISCFFTFQFDIFRKYMQKPPRFSNLVEYVNSNSKKFGKTKYLFPNENTMEENI
jgi:hypothetical protein